MKILVTGAAGFIGAAVIKRILEADPLINNTITGLDNINDYYSTQLKIERLALLGINAPSDSPDSFPWNQRIPSDVYPQLSFIRLDICDFHDLLRLIEQEKFDIVINFAAQAGVRYSIDHPKRYIKNNIDGFLNLLEACRHTKVKHLVYASSSSVYGLNEKTPFSESDSTAHPVSLYAVTKRSNELMAHVYSHLYGLPVTGLRFFTVYGPWGRPDMSPYLFMDAILNHTPIKVFNGGEMLRDFTYIDDVAEAVRRIMTKIPTPDTEWDSENPDPASSSAPYRIYNVGNSSPVNLLDYISCIERYAGIVANKEMLPLQPGDVLSTYADSSALYREIGFSPSTSLDEGIARTVAWHTARRNS